MIQPPLKRPEAGVHAVQMELACRGYLREPAGGVSEANWPAPYDGAFAAPLQDVLGTVLNCCVAWTTSRPGKGV